LWLNKFLVCAAVMVATAVHAEETQCPSYHEKNPLSGAVVFDGPPEERADLMPDVSRGGADHAYATWDVGYIFDSGRKLFLVCQYSGLTDTVTVKVDQKVRACIYESHPDGPAALRCS
jgi:hypothetical protein